MRKWIWANSALVRRLDVVLEKAPAEQTNKIRRDLERMELELGMIG